MTKDEKRFIRRESIQYVLRFSTVLSEIKRAVRNHEFASFGYELNLFV